MGIPGSPNPLLMRRAAAAADDGVYKIEKSLKFNPGDAPYLSKRLGVSGNRKKWTLSFWLKISEVTSEYPTIFSSATDGNTNNHFIIRLEHAAGELKIDERTSSSSSYSLQTVAVHRDFSSWYHFVIVFDSGHATSTERVRVYRNGIRLTLSGSYPAQDYESHWNESSAYQYSHVIGREAARSDYETSGYLADVFNIDGLALSPATFGAFSSEDVWNSINPFDSNGNLKLPAPNKGVTHSSTLTSSSGWNYGAVGDLFDGVATEATSINPTSGHTATWKPATEITGQFFEIYCKVEDASAEDHLTVNGINYFTDVYNQLGNNTFGWAKLNGLRSINTTQGLTFKRTDGNKQCAPSAIRVDGVILVDGQTDPETWDKKYTETFATAKSLCDITGNGLDDVSDSNHNTTDSGSPTYEVSAGTNSFGLTKCVQLDGSDDGLVYVNANLSISNTTDTTIDIHFMIDSTGSGEGYLYDFRTTGTGYCYYNWTSGNVDVTGASGTYASISSVTQDVWHHLRVTPTKVWLDGVLKSGSPGKTAIGSAVGGKRHAAYNGNWNYFKGKIASFRILNYDLGAPPAGGEVCVNGVLQKIPTKTHDQSNSFHLKFTDLASKGRLGRNFFPTLNVKLSSATGALPIYATTSNADDYDDGTILGSGLRADSKAANLVFALPGNGATGMRDVHHSVSGTSGSQVEVANTGNGGFYDADYTYQFYGMSARGNSDYAIVGGSGGTASLALGSGAFTVEAWTSQANFTSNGNVACLGDDGSQNLSSGTVGMLFGYAASNTLQLFASSNGSSWNLASAVDMFNGITAPTAGIWYHIAVSRDSSDNWYTHVNGVKTNTFTGAGTITAQSNKYCIGANHNNQSQLMNGEIQDFRVYVGDNKYGSSDFTVPVRNDFAVNNLAETDGTVTKANADSKPILGTSDDFGKTYSSGYETDSNSSSLVLAISGKTLADNHADIKGSGTNHSISNSSSTTSTSRSKFYGTAIATDGGSQHFVVADSSDFEFGSGEFTIEYWINAQDVANDGLSSWLMKGTNSSNNAFDWRAYASMDGSNANIYCDFSTSDGNKYMGANINNMPNDEWVHFAAVRDNTDNKFYIYKNGVKVDDESVASGATMNDTYSDGLTWGYFNAITGTNHYGFEGWVNDIRIYKGFCKYPGGTTFKIVTEGIPANLDSLVDSPTNYAPSSGSDGTGGVTRGNYCTLNPLVAAGHTYSQGNLTATISTSSHADIGAMAGTFPMSTGKWYFEFTASDISSSPTVGIALHPGEDRYTGYLSTSYGYAAWAVKINSNTQTSWGNSWAADDVIGCAFDADAGKIWWSKNGTWQESGNPATGANPAYSSIPAGNYVPAAHKDTTGSGVFTADWNFGQRAYNTAAPTGFKTLCSINLPDTFNNGAETAHNDPSKFFDLVLWTGVGGNADRDIAGVAFKPDLIWSKGRNTTYYHQVYDSLRTYGSDKALAFNENTAEGYGSAGTYGWYESNADGIKLKNGSGTDLYVDESGKTYVAWLWDCGTEGKAYAKYLTGGIDSNYPAINAFDGSLTSGSGVGCRTNQNAQMTFEPPTDIAFTKLRIYANNDNSGNNFTNTWKVNGTDVTSAVNSAAQTSYAWIDVTSSVSSPLDKIEVISTATGSNPRIQAIEVDDVILTANSVGDIAAAEQWVSDDAGFSITKFDGDRTNAGTSSVGHGISASKWNSNQWMILSKKIGSTSDWWVQHSGIADGSHVLKMNLQDDKFDASGDGAITTPTNTVWYGNWNSGLMASTSTTLAYVFTGIPGYSAFGKYEGTNDADGPMIVCGFQPKFLIIKNADSNSRQWNVIDTSRDPINESGTSTMQVLWADATTVEGNTEAVDILSNGFKIRTTGVHVNEDAKTFVYCAWAERPFKTSRAR